MEDQVIFRKNLSETDVNYRLEVPTDYLELFDPIPQGSNSIALEAMGATIALYGLSVSLFEKKGHHLKLVLANAGWLKFDREKKLKINDEITFFSVANQANGVRYNIQVQRKIVILGQEVIAKV